jgi:hypothetical protein
MNTIKGNNREKALQWWKGLTFEAKWFEIIKAKEYITGYPDRAPDSLTAREIQIIHAKNNHQ